MDRTVRKFSGHEAAAQADREYYQSLTPEQRLDILLDLIERHNSQNDASSQRLERVYRIVKFSQR